VRHALKLEQAAARANSLALLGQMSGALAHEIKNPLGIIRAAAERSQRATDPSERASASQYIIEEVDRLTRITSNYLAVGSQHSTASEAIDLGAVISDIVTSLSPETDRLGIKVTTNVVGSPRVPGNRLELRQALFNLVLNAIQSQPAGGAIEIESRLERTGRQFLALILVRDHGSGISRSDLKHVFDPFYTTRAQGSGLGLFVVQRVVETLHGQVTIQSEPGTGTTVTVRLPAIMEAESTNARTQ
ncbi:MAG: ATP-binding protein, partial [candidate division WOR-3 bacterium]